MKESSDSAVSKATGYGLDGGGVGVRLLVRVTFFSLRHVHGSEANSASYAMATGGFLLGF
jgi:hypothetical protein